MPDSLSPQWELVRRCPVCGSSRIEELLTQTGVYRLAELKTVYFQCKQCLVEFQNPRMHNMDDFYGKGFYRRMLGQSPARVSEEGVRRAATIIKFLQKRLSSVRSFLDFGSATGDLLDAVARTYGATVQGIEIDEKLAAYANAKGRNTTSYLCWEGYDLIAIVHTLEHLIWPTFRLQDLRERMVNGGYIYIEVPKGTYVDAHVISFSIGSLKHCAELAGFEVLETIEHNGDLILWGRCWHVPF